MAFIDSNLMALVSGIFVAVLAAIVYTVILKFKDDPNVTQPIDWPNLAANVIVGIVLGIVAWASGITVTIDWLGGQIAAYGVIIALLDHIISGLLNRTVRAAKFVFYDKDGTLLSTPMSAVERAQFLAGGALAAGLRKMSPASRHYLIFDLPLWAQQPTLNCVDEAELKNTFQYAIQTANWIYLIENGQLTGAKHFWTMFGWYGTSNVMWKQISPATLETIRNTGRIPDYANLV
jgi:hypothetical protein